MTDYIKMFKHCGNIEMSDLKEALTYEQMQSMNSVRSGRTYMFGNKHTFNIEVINDGDLVGVFNSAKLALDNQYDLLVVEAINKCFEKGTYTFTHMGSGVWTYKKVG